MKIEKPLCLKKVAVRCFYIVGSFFAYFLALRSVETLFSYFEYGHPTLKYTSLMILAALIIWLNVRKLSASAKRFVFGCFFLGLSLLVGARKIGCMACNYTDYTNRFVYWGALCVLLASLLPVACRQKSTRMAAISKICFWAAVLLLDFVVAMPNIWEDEQLYKCLYYNAARKLYVIKTPDVCAVLSCQDLLKSHCDENTSFRSVCYRPANGSDNLWVSEGGDLIYLTRGLNDYGITRPGGESFTVSNGSPEVVEWSATNCWQYNVWWKLKRGLNNKGND